MPLVNRSKQYNAVAQLLLVFLMHKPLRPSWGNTQKQTYSLPPDKLKGVHMEKERTNQEAWTKPLRRPKISTLGWLSKAVDHLLWNHEVLDWMPWASSPSAAKSVQRIWLWSHPFEPRSYIVGIDQAPSLPADYISRVHRRQTGDERRQSAIIVHVVRPYAVAYQLVALQLLLRLLQV